MTDEDRKAGEAAAAAEAAETPEDPTLAVEGDDLPKPRSAKAADSSGSSSEDKPKRGRPRKAAAAAKSLPAVASDRAVETASELYGLAGIGVSVAGFPSAAAVMQAQSEQGGAALANYALGHFPRVYGFLESTGKAGDLVPLVLAPIACEVYLRTENPQVEQLSQAILQGFLGDATIRVPSESGELVEAPVMTMILQARAQVVSQRAGRVSADVAEDMVRAQAEAQARADAASGNGSLDDVAAPDHEPSPAARAVAGDEWFKPEHRG